MLVDLIDKTISRAIQLVKQHEEQNAALCRDFLEPTQKAFEELHKEYITSFRDYKARLRDGKRTSLLDLIDLIEDDRLYLEHNRQKVLALVRFREHPQLGAYMTTLYEYLVNPHDFEDTRDGHLHRKMGLQRWRGSLLETLRMRDEPKRTPDEIRAATKLSGAPDWKLKLALDNPIEKLTECEKARRAIDILIRQMQDLYSATTYEYQRLRVELLSPVGIDLSRASLKRHASARWYRWLPSWLQFWSRLE